jgi:hypothetical protein
MTYAGRFALDHDGLHLKVDVPNDLGTRTTLSVDFTFEQLAKALDMRLMVHGVLARRLTEVIRTLDEED